MYRCIHLIATAIYLLSLSISADPLRAQALDRDAAVERALAKNPRVTAAQRIWEADRARADQARSWADPELTLEYEELPGITRIGDFGVRSYGATQTIEFPLAWWRRGQAARQAAKATQLSVLEMTQLDIRTEVRIAFDRVLFEQNMLDYAQQNAELAQSFLQKAQRRLEAGDVPELEVLRAEVEAGRAANRVAAARGDLSVAKAVLNTLLAEPSGGELELSGDLDYRPAALDLEKLQSIALKRHPDVLGADWRLESSLSAQGAARAALLPAIDLGIYRETVRGPADDDESWRVGLALEIPLWGAIRQRGELAEAKAISRQAVAESAAARSEILLAVESLFIEVQTAEKQVLLFQERIAREAERSLVIASRSYAEGKVTYLVLLEAQKAIVEVREEYAAALFNYRSALYRLERASGGALN